MLPPSRWGERERGEKVWAGDGEGKEADERQTGGHAGERGDRRMGERTLAS